jgi:hypothetical protein
VTRSVFEKVVQNAVQYIFVEKLLYILFRVKSSLIIWAKENSQPIGENLPKLVTLLLQPSSLMPFEPFPDHAESACWSSIHRCCTRQAKLHSHLHATRECRAIDSQVCMWSMYTWRVNLGVKTKI